MVINILLLAKINLEILPLAIYICITKRTYSEYKLKIMLSETQSALLKTIQDKLVRGDIGDISESTGKSRVYVSNVLSPSNDSYNEEIVTAAVRIIEKREQDTKKLLKKITPAA